MYGLSCLMEAMKQSESAEAAMDSEMRLMESSAEDDVRELFIGEDSVENDMNGNGIDEAEKEKLEDFISQIPLSKDAKVPEDEEDVSEDVAEALNLLESCTNSINYWRY